MIIILTCTVLAGLGFAVALAATLALFEDVSDNRLEEAYKEYMEDKWIQ